MGITERVNRRSRKLVQVKARMQLLNRFLVSCISILSVSAVYEWRDGRERMWAVETADLKSKFLVTLMERLVPTRPVDVRIETKGEGAEPVLTKKGGNYMQVLLLHSFNNHDIDKLANLDIIQEPEKYSNKDTGILYDENGESTGKSLKEYFEFATTQLQVKQLLMINSDDRSSEKVNEKSLSNGSQMEPPKSNIYNSPLLKDNSNNKKVSGSNNNSPIKSLNRLTYFAEKLSIQIAESLDTDNKMNEIRESLKDYGKHEFYFKDICQLRDKNMLQDMLTGICLFQKEIVEKKLPEYDIELITKESCHPNILKNYIVLGELLRSYKERFPGTNGMPPDSKSFISKCFCVESGDEEKINLISKRIEDYLKVNFIETLRMHMIDPLDVILKREVRDLFLDIFEYRQQCADFVNQLMGDKEMLLKFHGKSSLPKGTDGLRKPIAADRPFNWF